MITQTTKIKKGTIVLPSKIRKNWREADILLQASQDNIFIKRLQQPSVFEMVREFRKIGKKFSKKNLERAIKWARNEK